MLMSCWLRYFHYNLLSVPITKMIRYLLNITKTCNHNIVVLLDDFKKGGDSQFDWIFLSCTSTFANQFQWYFLLLEGVDLSSGAIEMWRDCSTSTNEKLGEEFGLLKFGTLPKPMCNTNENNRLWPRVDIILEMADIEIVLIFRKLPYGRNGQ